MVTGNSGLNSDRQNGTGKNKLNNEEHKEHIKTTLLSHTRLCSEHKIQRTHLYNEDREKQTIK